MEGKSSETAFYLDGYVATMNFIIPYRENIGNYRKDRETEKGKYPK